MDNSLSTGLIFDEWRVFRQFYKNTGIPLYVWEATYDTCLTCTLYMAARCCHRQIIKTPWSFAIVHQMKKIVGANLTVSMRTCITQWHLKWYNHITCHQSFETLQTVSHISVDGPKPYRLLKTKHNYILPGKTNKIATDRSHHETWR